MVDYVVVQAGGKGSRMEQLTANKPKALVPVNNLPMIFHLFRKFPDKHFIVIGDYKYDVLQKYLDAFADVDYKLVSGVGHVGTCAGLKEALSLIPEGQKFLLIWCDLVLPADYAIPDSGNIVGISKDFVCRWKYEKGRFEEERSSEHGVAGLFVFDDKNRLQHVPQDGEFVRWLQGQNIAFEEQPLFKTHEYGLYDEWDKLPKSRCRPFNQIKIDGDKVVKIGIDEQGKALAIREINWYKVASKMNFSNLPTIFGYEPLVMEKIDGKNVYEYSNIPLDRKRAVLRDIVQCLRRVHSLGCVPSDIASYRKAYLDKTYDRLEKIQKLVPFARSPHVLINGRKCRNVFFCKQEIENVVMSFFPSKFTFIHGDCTFSNILLRNNLTPVLIDPRGYFGNTELFGDPAYDWVKLYYSLVSNYDQFNLKRFRLSLNDFGVNLEIVSNGWEELEDDYFELLNGEVSRKQIKTLLAIVWLSLTTYAWEDYDSICGAFYNGLYYLEEALA